MKKTVQFLFLIFLSISITFPQNWPTIGGSNQRNGLSEITGPDSVTTPIWSVSSSQTVIGNSVFLLCEFKAIESISQEKKFICTYFLKDGSLLFKLNVKENELDKASFIIAGSKIFCFVRNTILLK